MPKMHHVLFPSHGEKSNVYTLADLTLSKRPGTSYQIEIHFAVVNHSYLLFSFVKLVETLLLSLIKKILPEV